MELEPYILLTEVKPRRWRYPRPRRDNLYIALGCFAIAMIAAIAAWGQPIKELPVQTDTTTAGKFPAPASVHYRCEKQKNGQFLFMPIDCESCLPVILSCVNCSCGDDK